jgi:hypothetical protein
VVVMTSAWFARGWTAAALSACALTAAVAVLFWTWTGVVHAFTHPELGRPATKQHPNAIVWGDRVFGSRPSFARWLGERGHTYAVWEQRHRAAARLLRSGKR